MRQIICLRTEEETGQSVTYQAGAGIGLDDGSDRIVRKLTVFRTAYGTADGAEVHFADGVTRCIPLGRIIWWELAPEKDT